MSYEPDKKLTSSDPRSRLHFIKYVTKDNETSKRGNVAYVGKNLNINIHLFGIYQFTQMREITNVINVIKHLDSCPHYRNTNLQSTLI